MLSKVLGQMRSSPVMEEGDFESLEQICSFIEQIPECNLPDVMKTYPDIRASITCIAIKYESLRKQAADDLEIHKAKRQLPIRKNLSVSKIKPTEKLVESIILSEVLTTQRIQTLRAYEEMESLVSGIKATVENLSYSLYKINSLESTKEERE